MPFDPILGVGVDRSPNPYEMNQVTTQSVTIEVGDDGVKTVTQTIPDNAQVTGIRASFVWTANSQAARATGSLKFELLIDSKVVDTQFITDQITFLDNNFTTLMYLYELGRAFTALRNTQISLRITPVAQGAGKGSVYSASIQSNGVWV